MKLNNENKNRQDQDILSAIPAPTTLVKDDSVLPTTYPGSGLNKSPARMMKIEEVVEWDMEYGVKFGPIGYDHRLTCPYCRKRMLLVSHEGSRHQKTIRILYQCENCGAHTVVQFHGPNQTFDLPELNLGEKIIIENPAPFPRPSKEEPTPVRQSKTANSNNRRQEARSNNKPLTKEEPEKKAEPKNQKPKTTTDRNRNKRNKTVRTKQTQDNPLQTPAPNRPLQTSTPVKHPAIKLPSESIKKLQTSTGNQSNVKKQEPEKKSNAYFRSRNRPKTNTKS